MRMGTILLLCAAATGGCSFPSAPRPPARAGGGEDGPALLAAGAVAGAGIGYALDGRTGSLAGGAAGLAAAALLDRAGESAASREAAEQARREERVKLMQRYWNERTLAPEQDPGGATAPALLDYPAGDYAGINFAPRLAASPDLGEPVR